MNDKSDERLYNLLPEIYRIRDTGQGEPLRALLAIIEREADRLERDIDGLYDDWFIETCSEWVAPYIADLLGVQYLHNVESAGIYSQRAYVANTLGYRRRKGTAPVLEQLARDVTGWPARAVEFFERLITNQHSNHVRLHNTATPDLRKANQLELLGGPFENAAHTLEVRRIIRRRGKYNIPNLGIFLWRLQEYVVLQSAPRPAVDMVDGRYRFSPFGNDIPLFNRPETETEITHLANEINVPDRLRRRVLFDELESLRQAIADEAAPKSQYLDTDPPFQIFVENGSGELESILPEEIAICDLSDILGETDWHRPPSSKTYISKTQLDNSVDPPVPLDVSLPIQVAVDPALGRLAFPEGTIPNRVAVTYTYGFSSDIGGGPYDRRDILVLPNTQQIWMVTVAQQDPQADYTTLATALADWESSSAEEGIVTITDSGDYVETLSLDMSNHNQLVIQASNTRRPTLRVQQNGTSLGEFQILGGASTEASLILQGLWIEGAIHIAANSLRKFTLQHCTLVPGRGLDGQGEPLQAEFPSLSAELPNSNLIVEIDHCIVGSLQLPDEINHLIVRDSIVDSPLRDGLAQYIPVLVSGSLSTFPTLTSATPSMQIQIGVEGPDTVTLSGVPTTLSQARDQLQDAIQAAHSIVAFTNARVITASNRLLLISGNNEPVTVSMAGDDPTSKELRLSDSSQQSLQALISPALNPFPSLTEDIPSLNITIGGEGPHPIKLSPKPATLVQARDQLRIAIHSAHGDPAFLNAIVANVDEQLLVLPGVSNNTILFGRTIDDLTTIKQLGLHANKPALSGDQTGTSPGPNTTLERVTVFGSILVCGIELASETIFNQAIVVQRRQSGCTRFCFLPKGSRAPRRYRCQPDLAIAEVAKSISKLTSELTSEQIETVLARLTPIYTSVKYCDPAYAQLGQSCAKEIHTGAEDGSEMGVFQHLKQPQRESNLQGALENYLRYGLQAGIFFVK